MFKKSFKRLVRHFANLKKTFKSLGRLLVRSRSVRARARLGCYILGQHWRATFALLSLPDDKTMVVEKVTLPLSRVARTRTATESPYQHRRTTSHKRTMKSFFLTMLASYFHLHAL